MRFEKKELKPFAEPVSERDLRDGSVYFSLNYLDDEMLIPNLEAVVFVGRNLNADDVDQVYFQDAESYRRGTRYGSEEHIAPATFYVGSVDEVKHIFAYEQALDELIRCALRRKKALRVE